jgi:hypothetical protein
MNEEAGPTGRDERIFGLLDHYRCEAGDDRDKWVDRVMAWPDSTAKDLTRLHGSLLAVAWVEMNLAPAGAPGTGRVAECYRLTPAGRQALKRR